MSLEPYLATPIKLFIHDPALLKQTAKALKELGFTAVTLAAVQANRLQAIKQLFGEIKSHQGIILVNHPPKKVKDNAGVLYDDMAFADFYQGVASLNKSARVSNAELLGRCVPIFVSAQDVDVRQYVVEELFSFGILAAFMLQTLNLRSPWEEQVEERVRELQAYLSEFFLQRDHKLAEFKEYKSAEELRSRRAEAEKVMAEVEELKKAKDYDKAVALCRRVIELLPTDATAYLEGGRLLVKKRKYPPAMQMFRDAQAVSQELPTPNQEIAKLRVAQVQDHVRNRQAAGQQVDAELIRGYLAEANENFRQAMDKAERIQSVRRDGQEQARKNALAAIVEDILDLDLEETLGAGNQFSLELARLAQGSLPSHAAQDQDLPLVYRVQFAMLDFHEGRYDDAERKLMAIALEGDEAAEEAARKLNFMGLRLRRKGEHDRAIAVYRQLLELKPPFLGVALFNLAVAVMSKSQDLRAGDPDQAAELERQALGVAVEALYVDPGLPLDDSFYKGTAIAPCLARAQKLFAAAVQAAAAAPPPASCGPDPGDDPLMAQCRQACQALEAHLAQGRDKEALHYLFGLTQTLKPFFLQFDKYASQPVAAFAARLHPRLLVHPQPQMQIFGKVLGVLISRGQAAQAAQAAAPPPELSPRLAPVMEALERADQAGAARELALALAAQPGLIAQGALNADSTFVNLAREVQSKLGGVEMAKFG